MVEWIGTRDTEEESGQWGTAIPAIAAAVAQLVEHVLGKDEVIGSSPISSSCAAWFVASAGLDNIYFRLAGGKNSWLTARKRLQNRNITEMPLGNFNMNTIRG